MDEALPTEISCSTEIPKNLQSNPSNLPIQTCFSTSGASSFLGTWWGLWSNRSLQRAILILVDQNYFLGAPLFCPSRRRRPSSDTIPNGCASERCWCWGEKFRSYCLQCQYVRISTVLLLNFFVKLCSLYPPWDVLVQWESLIHAGNSLLLWLPFKLISSYLLIHYRLLSEALKGIGDITSPTELSEEENFKEVCYKLCLYFSLWGLHC